MPVVVLALVLLITNWIASEPFLLWPIAVFRMLGAFGWIALAVGILSFIGWCLGGDRTPVSPVMSHDGDRNFNSDVSERDQL